MSNPLAEFESGTIELSGLEISVTLKPTQYYKHVVVSNLEKQTQSILHSFGHKNSYSFNNQKEGTELYLHFPVGLELPSKKVEQEAYVAFFKNTDDSAESWVAPFVQAYLESGMLYKFGLKEVLQNEVGKLGLPELKKSYPNLALKELLNEKLFCCIGGFVGVAKKGFNISHAEVKNDPYPYMSLAYRLLYGEQPENTSALPKEKAVTALAGK